MDANHWERSECTQHRSAHSMETSWGSWTMATNRWSGYVPINMGPAIDDAETEVIRCVYIFVTRATLRYQQSAASSVLCLYESLIYTVTGHQSQCSWPADQYAFMFVFTLTPSDAVLQGQLADGVKSTAVQCQDHLTSKQEHCRRPRWRRCALSVLIQDCIHSWFI